MADRGAAALLLLCSATLAAAAVLAALAAPAHALKAYAVTDANTVLTFDTATPGTTTLVPLTIPAGESIMGIDFRPTTGEFFAITVPTGSPPGAIVRTYRIDIDGMVLAGQTQSALPAADDVPTGYDFNPVTDLATYVNVSDENARLQSNGTIFSDDANLASSTGVVAVAYDRSADGASATTLYAIDDTTDSLGTIGGVDGNPAPDGGAFNPVGPLSTGINADSGFDIASNGSAFAALTTGSDAELYTVNLATGQTTLIGDIANAVGVRALAIVAPSPPTKTPPVDPQPQPTPGPGPDTTSPKGLVDVGAQLKIKQVIRSGLGIGFSCNEACSAQASLIAGDKTIANGVASLSGADAGQLLLTVTSDGKKKLKKAARSGKDRLKTTLEVVFTDSAGNTSTLERSLTLSG